MPAGRPPKWKTPEELEKKILEYYAWCEGREKPLTIAGLAYWLNVDRQTIYNYAEKDEFIGTIKKARDLILLQLEEILYSEGKAGQIFLAKNYGYTDRQDHVITAEVKNSHEYHIIQEKLKEDPESREALKHLYRRSKAMEGAGVD